jgi:bifunctional DNA-binding transcriptional regulator/antitoxin component of YhaV-PrlF toxin-antitoxin module
MPLAEEVEFLARLQKLNRVQIPVEVRWRYKLEKGQILKVEVQPLDGLSVSSEGFVARLLSDGRITIPWEVAQALELDKPGCMLRVWLVPQ